MSTGDFSNRAMGSQCNDNDACTVGESCDGQGTCGGGTVFKDTDMDTYVDAACPGGTDCNDNDNMIHPSVPDPLEGIDVVSQPADVGGQHGTDLSVVAAADGQVHAAWFNPSQLDLEYARPWGERHLLASVDRTGDVGRYTAMAVDAAGAFHIIYQDASNYDVKHASNSPGQWLTENLTGNVSNRSGLYNAFAISPDGALHVVYQDSSSADLVYQRGDTTGWTAPAIIDGSGSVGEAPSMVVDSVGALHISYHNGSGGELKYATNASGAFVTQVVDTSGTVGRRSAITMDAAGILHIFYTDSTNASVHHAYRQGDGTWARATVFSSTPVQAAQSIRLTTTPEGGLLACMVLNTGLGAGDMVATLETVTTPWLQAENYLMRTHAVTTGTPAGCAVVNAGPAHSELWWNQPPQGDVYRAVTALMSPGYETVDGAGTRGEHASLFAQSDGTLHVAYYDGSASALRYATRTPGQPWATEEVNNAASVGRWASLKVDASSTVHIAYYDASNTALQYVSGVAGAWALPELVDNAAAVGEYAALALDGAGAPHIAYFDNSSNRLKVASRGVTWSSEAVPTPTNSGEYASLAIDSGGTFHVAYRNSSATELGYVRGVPGVWEPAEPADTVGDCGRWNSMVIDAAGNPHIFHYSTTNATSVRHTYSSAGGAAGSFVTETVAADANNQAISAAVDAQGTLWVAYSGNTGVQVASNAGGTWNAISADPVSSQSASLAVRGSGQWDVVYQDTNSQDLRRAGPRVPSWSGPQVVAYAGEAGRYTSTVVDSFGVPSVSHWDPSRAMLRYTTRMEGLWFGTWLDDSASVGTHSAMALGPDGILHLAYRNETSNSLQYGMLQDGVFVFETVGTGNVGTYNSVTVDAAGLVHMAFYGLDQTDLRYAEGNSGNFMVTTVEGTGDTGRYANVATDSNGVVHLAWQYTSAGDLRYTNRTNGVFAPSQDVETTGTMGQYASLAVDAAGVVHLAHKDASNGDLRYATNRAGSFVGTAVDTNGNVGDHARLALDAAGNVYIAYQDASSADVKLATNLSGAWQTFAVDTPNSLGVDLSMAVTLDGRVFIFYRDESANILKGSEVIIRNAVDQNCDGF